MKRNTHFIVKGADFKLIKGKDALSTYKFGTESARHTFCKVCGVCSYYHPRSNPSGVAITVACVEGGSITSIKVNKFDGCNWEDAHKATGIAKLTGDDEGGDDDEEEEEEDDEEEEDEEEDDDDDEEEEEEEKEKVDEENEDEEDEEVEDEAEDEE